MMLLNHPYADFYKLTGHPPWTGIAGHPSQYIAKKSCPNSDRQLQEPSHMKSDGVDAWLKHWLKLQKQNKRPLILKDGSDGTHPNLTLSSKHKNKASKAQLTDDNESDEGVIQEDWKDQSNEGDVQKDKNDQSNNTNDGDDTAKVLPPTPLSASETRMGCREFLATLSKDKNYQKLLLLIRAANVSNTLLSVNYTI
jgi:hypothetical protein